MRKLVIVAALAFAFPSFAAEVLLGTITSTGTTKNNSDTAVPFTLGPDTHNGAYKLSIQCDAAAYVIAGGSTAVTVAATTGVKLAADALFDIDVLPSQKWIAVISSSGTVNCRVFSRNR